MSRTNLRLRRFLRAGKREAVAARGQVCVLSHWKWPAISISENVETSKTSRRSRLSHEIPTMREPLPFVLNFVFSSFCMQGASACKERWATTYHNSSTVEKGLWVAPLALVFSPFADSLDDGSFQRQTTVITKPFFNKLFKIDALVMKLRTLIIARFPRNSSQAPWIHSSQYFPGTTFDTVNNLVPGHNPILLPITGTRKILSLSVPSIQPFNHFLNSLSPDTA